MDRRLFLLLAPALSACGFQLRQAPTFAFNSIAVPGNSPITNRVRRSLAGTGTLTVAAPSDPPDKSEVILDVISEDSGKVVVGLNAQGQVREFQLRSTFVFRLRTNTGKELIPQTELLQTRDISFNESQVLSKETEESLLYRDMQNDLVQQLMRRLAAVKSL